MEYVGFENLFDMDYDKSSPAPLHDVVFRFQSGVFTSGVDPWEFGTRMCPLPSHPVRSQLSCNSPVAIYCAEETEPVNYNKAHSISDLPVAP